MALRCSVKEKQNSNTWQNDHQFATSGIFSVFCWLEDICHYCASDYWMYSWGGRNRLRLPGEQRDFASGVASVRPTLIPLKIFGLFFVMLCAHVSYPQPLSQTCKLVFSRNGCYLTPRWTRNLLFLGPSHHYRSTWKDLSALILSELIIVRRRLSSGYLLLPQRYSACLGEKCVHLRSNFFQ